MLPMLTGYVDTHCHLNFKAFGADASEVIERAYKSGVKTLVVPGTDAGNSNKAIELAENFFQVWAAVGYHPIHVRKLQDISQLDVVVKEMQSLAAHAKVVAIGEIGLDYYREPYDKVLQAELLHNLLEVAKGADKPVILHSRQAMEDTLKLVVQSSKQWRGVWHCFEGNWQEAQRVLDLGLHIGFNGLISYGQDENSLEVVRRAPLERLVLETDSPFLTPVPKRGQRNEPANIPLIAAKVAELRGIGVDEVANITTKNAKRLFGID